MPFLEIFLLSLVPCFVFVQFAIQVASKWKSSDSAQRVKRVIGEETRPVDLYEPQVAFPPPPFPWTKREWYS
jgi:hypothetical protein